MCPGPSLKARAEVQHCPHTVAFRLTGTDKNQPRMDTMLRNLSKEMSTIAAKTKKTLSRRQQRQQELKAEPNRPLEGQQTDHVFRWVGVSEQTSPGVDKNQNAGDARASSIMWTHVCVTSTMKRANIQN